MQKPLSSMSKQELQDFRKMLITRQRQQTCTRRLIIPDDDDSDLRKSLRDEVKTNDSPPSYKGDDKAITRKLGSARDTRMLKLPSLKLRQSQDFSTTTADSSDPEVNTTTPCRNDMENYPSFMIALFSLLVCIYPN